MKVDNAQNGLVKAIVSVLADQRLGGLDGLVDHFVREGLGDVINSWISTEQNISISARQVQQALGEEMIARIARQARIPRQRVSSQIADVLPHLVDRLTPKGRIPFGGISPVRIDLLKGLSE